MSAEIPLRHIVNILQAFSRFQDDCRFDAAVHHAILAAGVLVSTVFVPISIIHQFVESLIICVCD